MSSTQLKAINVNDWKAYIHRRRLRECVQFRRTMRSYGWQRVGRDKKGRPLWRHYKSGAEWFEQHLHGQYEKWGISALEIPF